MVDHLVKLFRGHLLSSHQIRARLGSKSPERVLITNPEVGVKLMLVSMLLPSRTAAMLAPLPRCARMTRPVAAAGSPTRASSSIKIGVGQTMETVALHPLRIVAARDREQPGHPRYGAVKRRVKTGHLGQFRMTLAERLDQFDLAGQMIRIVRADAVQFIHSSCVTRSGAVCSCRGPPGVLQPSPMRKRSSLRANPSEGSLPICDRSSDVRVSGCPVGSWKVRIVPGKPMRSTFP